MNTKYHENLLKKIIMSKKQLIYLALLFAPFGLKAQAEAQNFITFEPVFSVMSINYKFSKLELSPEGEYSQKSPKAIGAKIGFVMPQYYSGIAIQYNYFPLATIGYNYNYRPLAPNDPTIPRSIEVQFKESQFSINPYFIISKNQPIKFTIGPVFTFIKNKYIKENLIMDNGKEVNSNIFSNEFNAENKVSTGAAISMLMINKHFCISLNSSLSLLNKKYYNNKQEKPATVFQFGIGIGYYLPLK